MKTGSVETATTVTNQYLVVRTHVDALSQAGLLPFLHMGLIGGMKGGAGPMQNIIDEKIKDASLASESSPNVVVGARFKQNQCIKTLLLIFSTSE